MVSVNLPRPCFVAISKDDLTCSALALVGEKVAADSGGSCLVTGFNSHKIRCALSIRSSIIAFNESAVAGQEGERGFKTALAFSLAILAALGGQWLVSRREYVAVGVGCFVLASVLFLAPLWRSPVCLNDERLDGGVRSWQPFFRSQFWRLFFLANALALALLAFRGFADNRLDGGFWLWLGALFYFAVTFGERPTGGWLSLMRRRWQRVEGRTWLAVAAITAVAVFFRVYRLPSVPAEMTSDHAEKLLDVYDVLSGRRPIFFPRNTGREMVQFYLTAILIRFTPLTIGHLALKVGTVLFGIVTVPLTFLLGRELYGRRVGLLAAFFLAVSHWHVAISRVGLRFPFTAAFAVPALYFLLRALKGNGRNDWLAAGATLGMGLHTYTAMRIVPLLFVLLIGVRVAADVIGFWRRERGSRIRAQSLTLSFWLNAVLGGLMALLAFLPLLRFMLERPAMFWYRAASRAGQDLSVGAAWRIFWGNVQDALLMFNYRGDVVPANTIPEAPELGLVGGALFVPGSIYLIWRLLRHREWSALYTLLAFFVLLLPSILSLAFPEENPSVVRAGGAVPFVMIVVAVPLAAIWQRLKTVAGEWTLARGLRAGLFGALLLIAIVQNFQWYFVAYDAHILRSSWNATEMGAVVQGFLESGGEMADVYHIPYPHWVDTRNIAINAGDITWRQAVTELSAISAHARDPSAKLYLLHPADAEALRALRSAYPDGTVERYQSDRPGKDFLIYRVPQDRSERALGIGRWWDGKLLLGNVFPLLPFFN